MKEELHHVVPVVKHGVDAAAGASILLSLIEVLTPVLNFFALILAIIWGVYRIIDMQLSNKIKKKELDND